MCCIFSLCWVLCWSFIYMVFHIYANIFRYWSWPTYYKHWWWCFLLCVAFEFWKYNKPWLGFYLLNSLPYIPLLWWFHLSVLVLVYVLFSFWICLVQCLLIFLSKTDIILFWEYIFIAWRRIVLKVLCHNSSSIVTWFYSDNPFYL